MPQWYYVLFMRNAVNRKRASSGSRVTIAKCASAGKFAPLVIAPFRAPTMTNTTVLFALAMTLCWSGPA